MPNRYRGMLDGDTLSKGDRDKVADNDYRWVLGTGPSPGPATSPRVQTGAAQDNTDLYEIARLIRGDRKRDE